MQAVGRWHVVYRSGLVDQVSCGSTPTDFVTRITAELGRQFQGGRVHIFAEAFACSPSFPDYDEYKGEEPEVLCGGDSDEMTTKVRAARR